MNLTNFAGQNWLITPAALAVGEQPPASIHDQKWLLVLTGVVTANLKGNSTSQWLNANLSFLPDMAGPNNSGPLNWAIGQYAIPKPAGDNYTIAFSLDEWAPFVSLSAIYDQNQSIDAGFAVNVWRPNHFTTGIDALSNVPVGNIFTGVNVDVGVRDTDAWILSLGYNIILRGRIVFPKVPVILFQSNFDSTPANHTAIHGAGCGDSGIQRAEPSHFADISAHWQLVTDRSVLSRRGGVQGSAIPSPTAAALTHRTASRREYDSLSRIHLP